MRKLTASEMNRPDPESFLRKTKLPVTIVLDNVRSGLNVGSVFRSADAFNVELICLCGITAKPPHREILKTALGATTSVRWQYFETTVACIETLAGKGYCIIGIEQTDQSTPLHAFEIAPDLPYALVFGNEIRGIDNDILPRLHQAIEIAQEGSKHSLNVAVCSGIVLWEFYKKLSFR